MRPRSVWATLLLLAMSLVLAASGLAQAPSPTPPITPTPTPAGPSRPIEPGTGVELTVYNQDVGLVKDVRTLQLEEGDNVVRFGDVAARIQPTSVHFVSLTDPEGTAVLEQNYEYDLVNSSRLLQRYIDQ